MQNQTSRWIGLGQPSRLRHAFRVRSGHLFTQEFSWQPVVEKRRPMKSRSTTRAIFQPRYFSIHLAGGLLAFFLLALLLFAAPAAHASAPQIPWECSTYEGTAQTRCLNAFIELQRERIAQLEGQLQAQQGTVGQLKNEVERQAAATADLQKHLTDRPATVVVPAPHPYAYVYPPTFGFGLYFGRPWIYAPPSLYRPYWTPPLLSTVGTPPLILLGMAVQTGVFIDKIPFDD